MKLIKRITMVERCANFTQQWVSGGVQVIDHYFYFLIDHTFTFWLFPSHFHFSLSKMNKKKLIPAAEGGVSLTQWLGRVLRAARD